MKKIILLILVILIGIGAYWYFGTEQKLKRKTKTIIEYYTVEDNNSSAGGAISSLFAEGLFAQSVELDSDIFFPIPFLNVLNKTKLPRENLVRAIQVHPQTFKSFTHEYSNMSYTKLSTGDHSVSFDHSFEFILKTGAKITNSVSSRTTFIYTEQSGKLKLSKVILKSK